MAWVTWRQHRIALGGVAAFLGALAVYLWIAGLQLHHAYAAVTTCHPAGSVVCSEPDQRLQVRTHDHICDDRLRPAAGRARADRGVRRGAGAGPRARDRHLPLRLDPGLRAVALDARQAGAARGRGDRRGRRLQPAVLLVLPAVHRRRSTTPCPASPSPSLFDLRGVTFAAWTLAAFAIGVLAGMLIRRVVPAIVATLAVYTGLALVAANFLRRHYLTPLLTSRLNVPVSAWIYSQWWTKGGTFAFTGWPPDQPPPALPSLRGRTASRAGTSPDSARRRSPRPRSRSASPSTATRNGPAISRPAGSGQFQWIEGGWLLALSALLIAMTVWWSSDAWPNNFADRGRAIRRGLGRRGCVVGGGGTSTRVQVVEVGGAAVFPVPDVVRFAEATGRGCSSWLGSVGRGRRARSIGRC